MTIYIPMIILTVFLADIQERIRYRGRKISILLITLLPPTLVAAFRYNNGLSNVFSIVYAFGKWK